MTYYELIEVLLDSKADEWLWNDERSTWTFKNDLNIRLMKKSEPELSERRRFEEEWATALPDSNAYATEYELWYGASFVKSYPFVDVDGFRASLPYPKSRKELVITREQLAVAAAVNGERSYFADYIKLFQISE